MFSLVLEQGQYIKPNPYYNLSLLFTISEQQSHSFILELPLPRLIRYLTVLATQPVMVIAATKVGCLLAADTCKSRSRARIPPGLQSSKERVPGVTCSKTGARTGAGIGTSATTSSANRARFGAGGLHTSDGSEGGDHR